MRRDLKAWPALLALALLAGAGWADDKETAALQRKAAEENWGKLEAGEACKIVVYPGGKRDEARPAKVAEVAR